MVLGILEVVSNPWRFMLENWLCDSDLDNPTGIDRVLTEKDLLVNTYSDFLEASILDEKQFLLMKSFRARAGAVNVPLSPGSGGGMKSSIATRKSTVIFRTFISVVSLIFQEARCGLKK